MANSVTVDIAGIIPPITAILQRRDESGYLRNRKNPWEYDQKLYKRRKEVNINVLDSQVTKKKLRK